MEKTITYRGSTRRLWKRIIVGGGGSDPIGSRSGDKIGKGATVSKLRRVLVIVKRENMKWCGVLIIIVLVEEMQ